MAQATLIDVVAVAVRVVINLRAPFLIVLVLSSLRGPELGSRLVKTQLVLVVSFGTSHWSLHLGCCRRCRPSLAIWLAEGLGG